MGAGGFTFAFRIYRFAKVKHYFSDTCVKLLVAYYYWVVPITEQLTPAVMFA